MTARGMNQGPNLEFPPYPSGWLFATDQDRCSTDKFAASFGSVDDIALSGVSLLIVSARLLPCIRFWAPRQANSDSGSHLYCVVE